MQNQWNTARSWSDVVQNNRMTRKSDVKQKGDGWTVQRNQQKGSEHFPGNLVDVYTIMSHIRGVAGHIWSHLACEYSGSALLVQEAVADESRGEVH